MSHYKSFLDDFPQSSDTHDTERLAKKAFTDAIEKLRLFNIQSSDSNDYGTDLQLEAREHSQITNSRVHVQLKGTSCNANKDGSVSVQVNRENLNYLLMQPHSIYICYHIPSEQLFAQYAEEICSQYEHSSTHWRKQKSITVNFKILFSDHYQKTFHALVLAAAKSTRDNRLEWALTNPVEISKKIQSTAITISVPNNIKTAYNMLVEMLNAGQDQEISLAFPQFEAIFKNHPELLIPAYMAEVNLGINGYIFNETRVQNAILNFQQYETEDSFQNGNTLYNIGNAHMALRDNQKAIAAYDLAISKIPRDSGAEILAQCYKNLGSIYRDIGNHNKAKSAYEQSLNLYPNLAEANFAMALCLFNEGDYANSLKHLDNIVWEVDFADRPAAVQAWRIPVFFNLGESDSAFREINTLLSQASKLEWIWPWCAEQVAKYGKENLDTIQRSLLFWKKYILKFPSSLKGKYEYIMCSWRLNAAQISVEMDYATFKREALLLIDNGYPDKAFLWDRIGHWAQDEENWEDALEAYRKACETEPDTYGYCLGVALNYLEKYEEALPILEAQAKEHMPDALSWFQVAAAYSGLGDHEKAIMAYERSIELDPENDLPWFNLGGAYWNIGNLSEALSVWVEAMDKFPKSEMIAKTRTFIDRAFKKA